VSQRFFPARCILIGCPYQCFLPAVCHQGSYSLSLAGSRLFQAARCPEELAGRDSHLGCLNLSMSFCEATEDGSLAP
jgi:hypothetical protein